MTILRSVWESLVLTPWVLLAPVMYLLLEVSIKTLFFEVADLEYDLKDDGYWIGVQLSLLVFSMLMSGAILGVRSGGNEAREAGSVVIAMLGAFALGFALMAKKRFKASQSGHLFGVFSVVCGGMNFFFARRMLMGMLS